MFCCRNSKPQSSNALESFLRKEAKGLVFTADGRYRQAAGDQIVERNFSVNWFGQLVISKDSKGAVGSSSAGLDGKHGGAHRQTAEPREVSKLRDLVWTAGDTSSGIDGRYLFEKVVKDQMPNVGHALKILGWLKFAQLRSSELAKEKPACFSALLAHAASVEAHPFDPHTGTHDERIASVLEAALQVIANPEDAPRAWEDSAKKIMDATTVTAEDFEVRGAAEEADLQDRPIPSWNETKTLKAGPVDVDGGPATATSRSQVKLGSAVSSNRGEESDSEYEVSAPPPNKVIAQPKPSERCVTQTKARLIKLDERFKELTSEELQKVAEVVCIKAEVWEEPISKWEGYARDALVRTYSDTSVVEREPQSGLESYTRGVFEKLFSDMRAESPGIFK